MNNSFSQTLRYVSDELLVMLPQNQTLETFLQEQSELGLTKLGTISARMNLHRFRIENPVEGSLEKTCTQLMQEPGLLAQCNHYIQGRRALPIFPNDSLFQSQWNLDNQGQTLGVPDADIDAPEAWDINTGGLSAHGDTIVIAVIDEGFNLNHPDLTWWRNKGEIPHNGLDDDQNGYIDDVLGWNVLTQNAELPLFLHGTHVAGIAAATGNNDRGVSGVSWNTQILPIVGFDLNRADLNVEANVLAAYSYVYEQRYLYNRSAGKSGAFIVATNTSFGLEQATPANTPLWCAMYDSLGSVGILNAVATTNFSRDVDVAGDIPSTCPSEYVIAVTNTNRSDGKSGGNQAGGLGKIHIDLAAPGVDILSTGLNKGYSVLTGTSMAAPHVAGTLSLLFSQACSDLLAQYKNNPSALALNFREWLLAGVDTLDFLVDQSSSGGRLNAHQALLNLEEACLDTRACSQPYFVQVSQKTDSSLHISWNAGDSILNFQVRYREAGRESWDSLAIEEPFLDLSGLIACSDYEFQIQALCSDGKSDYTPIQKTQTAGCCEAPSRIHIEFPAPDSVHLQWNTIFGADSFHITIFQENSVQGQTFVVQDSFISLGNILPCIAYTFRLRSICSGSSPDSSQLFAFRSPGCGTCIEGPYCVTSGNTQLSTFGSEWIDSVLIGTAVSASGDNLGQAAFLDSFSISLAKGIAHPIRLVPGYSGDPFREAWRVWIDLNHNGRFEDPEEEVLGRAGPFVGPVVDSIFIPSIAQTGETRMRIAMRFLDPPPVCGDFINGEVEDYCITLFEDSSLCLQPADLSLIALEENQATLRFRPASISFGTLVRLRSLDQAEYSFISLAPDDSVIHLTTLIPCTGYEISIANLCEEDTSSFILAQKFITPGCGACTDLAYCETQANSSAEEWIQAFQLGNRVHETGNNQGYGDFSYLNFTVSPGNKIPFEATPGFANTNLGELWRIWIDWNQDGSFDNETELAFSSPASSTRPITDSLEVPPSALTGITRMRVAMRFASPPEPCGAYDFGEIEDYCLIISPTTSSTAPLSPRVSLFPNPAIARLFVQSDYRIHSLTVYALTGEKVKTENMRGSTRGSIDTRSLSTGIYLIELETASGKIRGRFAIGPQ